MSQDSRITRRSLVQKVASLGAGAALSASRADATPDEGRQRRQATAFALIGDRFHNSDYIRSALGKTLVREAGLSIDFTDEVTALKRANLEGRRLLIVFRDGRTWPYGYGKDNTWPGVRLVSDPPLLDLPVGPIDWMSPAQGKNYCDWMTQSQGRAVREYVASGGAALFYHNVTHIGRVNREFREVLGAATRLHPPIRPFKVKVVNPDHPITRGVKDFVVTDEQHFMEYDRDPKYVLLRSVNEDGHAFGAYGTTCEAGWAYDYGKGRVCYLMPGHMISALWNPEYEKVQKNAVRWLLRET